MAITFHSEIADGLLLITASGRDEDVQQVIDYGSAVIDLAVESGVTLILCDERNLEYALDTFDTFKSAQQIAEIAPKVIRVAIVCGAKFLEDGKFWETVAVNRALQVRVDTDIEQAKAWLVKPDS
ncbi:MAG: hypothetical protein HGB15_06890 [Chlorobaculum sp.]|nr:hypothetical protein [Chlorobaculum sp.]